MDGGDDNYEIKELLEAVFEAERNVLMAEQAFDDFFRDRGRDGSRKLSVLYHWASQIFWSFMRKELFPEIGIG